MDPKAEQIARLLFGLIAPLVLEALPRGERTRRAKEITARFHDIPYSAGRTVAIDTHNRPKRANLNDWIPEL